MRIAVIGCGAIARRQHVPALQAAGATVAVFASRTLASARAAAEEAGGGDVTDDWREAVTRDDVDAVTVCTPNALHAEVAIAAAEAGKHVLVEKPFATSVAAADTMIAAARDAGVVMMAAHNVRFAAPFAPLRDAVRAGDLGEVTSVRVTFCHGGPQQWAPDAAWFRDADAAGGGALMDLGVHVADTVRHVLGDEFVEVAATLDRSPIDEDALVTFRLASGAVGSFHAGWRASAGPDQSMVVHGTRGSVVFDPAGGPRLLLPDAAPQALALPTEQDDPCAAFVRAVGADGEPTPSAADGRAAVAVVEAAYRSARTGTVQEVAR